LQESWSAAPIDKFLRFNEDELRIALCNQCLLSLNLLTQKRGSGFDNIATDSAKIERSHANELIPTAS
jgi:hypothetical protein